MPQCPSDNTQAVDQTSFWDSNGIHWDQHRIGWAIAGATAVLTVLISLVSIIQHARNYTNRSQQRQILRILYMPPVYAVISFFSYRFFRSYTYYSLVETSASCVLRSPLFCILLLIDFVAATAVAHRAENAILRKDKTALPIPFCCWRYRPTKAYFMYTLKWSVLQYVLIRPAISITGIICQAYNVLCESQYSVHFASVYLDSVDFVSISIALYGLIVFYALTREELAGRRPLAKFLAIKLIVFFTFYQSFVFSALQSNGVIHATEFWTATNIADGLNALATCIEMVFFALFMMWAYNWKEYVSPDGQKTSIWRPLLDSVNYSDFALEIFGSLRFFVDYARGKPNTHGVPTAPDFTYGAPKVTFGQAFGVEGYMPPRSGYKVTGSGYDDVIHLHPYEPENPSRSSV
ncbi:DUF300-domain-containing protein [Vararia minispora EC-137]|uniref:DUF300-domain-containing protein n=1 Tax=Vararia minispora EC-137 TaxID=1314806 RepID=A0ACB8QI87_9AGAM|nr:DUF300-domain-containing protein [Vararia minispora EC-137]